MLKRFFRTIGFAIAGTSYLVTATTAVSLPPQAESTARPEANAPLCYIQFQGRSAIDVTNVCGKKPGETPNTPAIASVSSAVAPPVFNPKATNASTTGQCNFVDANGNPCAQNRD